nr:hypothetical protein [Leptospira interrogans]
MKSQDIREANRLLSRLPAPDFEGLLVENLRTLRTRAKGNPLTHQNIGSFICFLTSSVLQPYAVSGWLNADLSRILKDRLMYVYNTLSAYHNAATFDAPTVYIWDILDSLVATDSQALQSFARTFHTPSQYKHHWICLNTNAILNLINSGAGGVNPIEELQTAKFKGKFEIAFFNALGHLTPSRSHSFWLSLSKSLPLHRRFAQNVRRQ